jgi:hypothetical protein
MNISQCRREIHCCNQHFFFPENIHHLCHVQKNLLQFPKILKFYFVISNYSGPAAVPHNCFQILELKEKGKKQTNLPGSYIVTSRSVPPFKLLPRPPSSSWARLANLQAGELLGEASQAGPRERCKSGMRRRRYDSATRPASGGVEGTENFSVGLRSCSGVPGRAGWVRLSRYHNSPDYFI